MSADFQIRAGFMPLLDSALLVVAREMGFAAREGLELTLVREISWANIRDRLAVGHFDVAHMLAPMPIACNLGLSPLAARTWAPMALGLGGNAVTVSTALWSAMTAEGALPDLDPTMTGIALKAVVARRGVQAAEPLRFAVVHPHSGHNYELRYWLAASGIDPDRDIEIVILPPPLMADALGAGRIDGYCAGEPWNTAAVDKQVGRIVTAKAMIWKSSPEKVLGVAARWADANPEALAALLRALYRAAEWCGAADNHAELARLLAGPGYVDCPPDWFMPALSGRIPVGDGVVHVPDFFLPQAKAATFPWKSHALWFYAQIVRWGQVTLNAQNELIARETYRPDLYRAALKPLGVALPGANAKIEGALMRATPVGSAGASLVLGPDGFFDGRIFDPDHIDDYLRGTDAAG
ncbi:CmpA/NrtA family ABC transporter substrate-binding protein [Kaistia dalseonensis]|uniref:NitT/TauT family transport system ATP-binding protein n=1 Tax=Kaistia dalseonensis TaxID=410840 RepID=A0ABU0H972_9HYPH|nr:CmpA/NrtA family ABC transporter substrate-binding protein [Kaistia dalseonensis]MCX5496255.1 CmpA/NrtA family ABC transporter substrate-binding protein [Kaistia dalseonensis]MDQ0438873.1 NitT/TauT family transport system ATP-binding protein [Kaistia dalseonensis]